VSLDSEDGSIVNRDPPTGVPHGFAVRGPKTDPVVAQAREEVSTTPNPEPRRFAEPCTLHPAENLLPSSVPVDFVSPIWRDRVHFRPEVDGFVPRTQSLNL